MGNLGKIDAGGVRVVRCSSLQCIAISLLVTVIVDIHTSIPSQLPVTMFIPISGLSLFRWAAYVPRGFVSRSQGMDSLQRRKGHSIK
jgi:hypothetical protein